MNVLKPIFCVNILEQGAEWSYIIGNLYLDITILYKPTLIFIGWLLVGYRWQWVESFNNDEVFVLVITLTQYFSCIDLSYLSFNGVSKRFAKF